MAHIDRKYHLDTDPVGFVILIVSNYTAEELAEIESCCVTRILGARYNIDNTKCIMKYRGDTPAVLLSYPTYSFNEIHTILKHSSWCAPETSD